MSPLQMWGGIECSVVRMGRSTRNQLRDTGHLHRTADIGLLAALGLRTVRYPVLWEMVEPRPGALDWRWTDRRLALLRKAGIEPVATLLHHGSGPKWTDLLDPDFPEKLAGFAARVAERYPWITRFTPVNEPFTTARFCGLYGHWHPHGRDEATCFRITVNECRGIALAMQAIRRLRPDAQLVQTEDLGRIFATPEVQPQADYENERRWLSLDLLTGRVSDRHPLHARLRDAGVSGQHLAELVAAPCPPDIVGLDYYLTSDRVLDHRLVLHPNEPVGGNGRQSYVDIAAVRSAVPQDRSGLTQRLLEVWQRYRIPVAVTEMHNGCSRDEHLRWLMDGWKGANAARAAGADVRAVTSWSLFGACDWNSLMTRRDGHYECGAFDARSKPPTPTIVATAISALVRHGRFDHPVLDGAGWWHRGAGIHPAARPLILSGGSRLVTRLAGCCDRRRLRVLRTRKTSGLVGIMEKERAWVAVSLESGRPGKSRTRGVTCRFPDGSAVQLHLPQPATEADLDVLLDKVIDLSVQPRSSRAAGHAQRQPLPPSVGLEAG